MPLQYEYKNVSGIPEVALERANELGKKGWRVINFFRHTAHLVEYWNYLMEKSSEMVEKPAHYHLSCCRHDHDH